MNYPENLRIGDAIGICAPSMGITDPEKLARLDEAEKTLKELGYGVVETPSVRQAFKGRSASAKQRADEFMSLIENEAVGLIISATGGDYLCEILDYLDLDKIKSLRPKWFQGYSDNTGIGYILNEYLEIPSIYGQCIKDYAMKPLHESLINALKLVSGEDELVQNSFEKCEKPFNFYEPHEENETSEIFNVNKGYELTENVCWKNLKREPRIAIKGRAIGGCLDCILNFIGTKYDKVSEYIDKYQDDGIIWFFDCFELGSAALYRALWQMKNAGYFEHCTGIVFGRPMMTRDDYGISFNDSILEALGNMNIPIIADCDIGHVSPQFSIVNGAVIEIVSQDGKGILKTYLK